MIPTPAPSALPSGSTSIIWFRNDLRVRDHAALRLANTADTLVPVYVFDKSQFGPDHLSPHGFQRTGPFRAEFLVDTVRNLRNDLRLRGSDMILRQGYPVEELLSIVQELVKAGMGNVHVVTHKEVTWEEEQQEKKLKKGLAELAEEKDVQCSLHFVWGSTLHHLDDLPFNAGGPGVPATFTAYRKLIEAKGGPSVRSEIEMPARFTQFPLHLKIPTDPFPSLRVDLEVEGLCEPHDYPFPHPLAAIDFKGGAKAGEERLREFIWEAEALSTYKETRNQSGTRESSSKLSPWLAMGCVSPRTVYWEVKRFEQQVVANESTYWMIFELMTRDYFRWIATSVDTKLFALNGYSGEGADKASIWNIDPSAITPTHNDRLRKWIAGRTGSPFVDSSMRELASTGFMSNRGRQNVASYLIHDLEYPDWRAGAEYFESILIDHDVASNWANWAYLAGVGSDPRGGRKFNVIKQSMDYDPDGWFITRWCPELLPIPPPIIHEPHTLSLPEQEDLGVILGEAYPKPIVKPPRAPVKRSK